MKKIVVTTQNEGKLGGVRRGFEDYAAEQEGGWPHVIIPTSEESGVSDTPLSDEEGLLGCSNRLRAAQERIPDADFYVAVEGVVAPVEGEGGEGWHVRGWTMLYDRGRDRLAQASGASVPVPKFIGALVSAGSQFSHVTRDAYPVSDDESAQIRDIGANGVFSDGYYTRDNTFYDGVRICLAYVDNERNWPTQAGPVVPPQRSPLD